MTMSFNKILRFLLLICILNMSVFLILFPGVCADTSQAAIDVCLNTVIPALFPFLICSGFFSASGFTAVIGRYLSPVMRLIFGLPGCSAASFILGLISGYPVGAVFAADLYASGQCSKKEAEHMCAFCNNSGPLFIVSVVGCSFLTCPKAGWYLYIAHILSAVLVGFLFRFRKGTQTREAKNILPPSYSINPQNAMGILGQVMDSSVFTMLKICGFIVFFSVFVESLPKSPVTPYLHSIFEITGGVQKISQMALSFDMKMCIISFFIAFSGISVMFQVSSVISPHGLSITPYFLGKVLQGILSFFICRLMLKAFPITQSAFAQQKSPAAFATGPLQNLFYSLFIIGIVVLFFALILAALKFLKKPSSHRYF